MSKISETLMGDRIPGLIHQDEFVIQPMEPVGHRFYLIDRAQIKAKESIQREDIAIFKALNLMLSEDKWFKFKLLNIKTHKD